MQDLAIRANPLSYLPWQETFFCCDSKNSKRITKAWARQRKHVGS
jgi:hypothetical protein